MKTDDGFYEASAPGRLDIMGGIADYSGSLVLQLPIHQRTSVTIKLRSDYRCTIRSKTKSETFEASADYRSLLEDGKVNYEFAKRQFKKNKKDAWTAYVLGCALVLQKEKQIEFIGADFLIQSDVPLGKGVSSSAALEVATMKALRAAFGLTLEGTQLPVLAQRVENLVVGAPCGLMDQLTSFFGQSRKLLPILCQRDKILKPVAFPSDVFFMGIDSGIRHSVGAASYADVRCAAFMGYTILARYLGTDTKDILDAAKTKDFSRLPFGGYLCNVPVVEFEKKFKDILPESMTGKDFLDQYPGTIDDVTFIKETTRYAIYPCTAHPVYEHERVSHFLQYLLLLNASEDLNQHEKYLRKMGELMNQSHKSYSQCGLGSDRTNEIVALANEKKNDGIFGAKITGGGNGGTVGLLAGERAGQDAVRKLHRQVEKKYKTTLALFEI